MKFKINRDIISSILYEYSFILKENIARPQMSTLYILAREHSVMFMGTNFNIELIKEISCPVEEPGNVVLNIALLYEYIKLLDSDEIVFTRKDDLLVVENAEFSILSENNSIPFQKTDGLKVMEIDGNKLSNLLEKASFAAYQGSDQINLNCLRILFSSEEMQIVTTDSYRLLFLSEKTNCTMDTEISLPLGTANIILNLLKRYENKVEIFLNDNNLILIWENTYFSAKLVALPYPDYKTIFNNLEFDKKIELNKNDLRSALKRVLTIAKTNTESKNGGIFNFKNKTLSIHAVSEKSKTSQKVEIMKTGEDLKASLNCNYILNFLEHIENNVIIECKTPNYQFKFTEAGNANYFYILMPLNISDL